MLKLALEIPTSMLEELTPLTDLDFILAHKVLQDEKYAEHFKNRPADRELILDNSTHEFATKDAVGNYIAGTPLPLEALKRASELCRADILIAPDVVNDQIDYNQYQKNLGWMEATCAAFAGKKPDIAGVLCGRVKPERIQYLDLAQRAGLKVLCFTFHTSQRLRWWIDFVNSTNLHSFKRVHILGVSSLAEMQAWYEISEAFRQISFSIDTTKAVKWGVQLKKIDELVSLRGGPIDAKAVLELPSFTDEQIRCVKYNIDVLKRLCVSGAW